MCYVSFKTADTRRISQSPSHFKIRKEWLILTFAKASGSILLKNKDIWMHRRGLTGSQVCVLFERSLADPELAVLTEVSVKSAWYLSSYDGRVQLPQAKGHLICFLFEASVYIT